MTAPSGGTGVGLPNSGIELSTRGVKPISDPTSDATANTRIIKGIMANAGQISLTPSGTYLVNDTLTIQSNTFLYLAPGVTLKQAPNTNTRMLVTKGYNDLVAGGTTVTITWSAGLIATVNWTAHGLTNKDFVVIKDAAQGEFNNIFPVFTVTDANSFTVFLTRLPTTTATGTIKAIKCTTDFWIGGGGNQWLSGAPLQATLGTVAVYGWDIPLDPAGVTNLATTNGQFCTSTNATANKQGPAVRAFSINAWYALATGVAGVNTAI